MFLVSTTFTRLTIVYLINISIFYTLNLKDLKILVKLPLIIYIVDSYNIRVESIVKVN